MKNQLKIEQSEGGFASIVIAIVIIIVLSLITIGFAQLMRREQREALDRQLSTQAYYAAESGVNLATSAIANGFMDNKTNCTIAPTGDSHFFPSNMSNVSGIPVGGQSVASYVTCLLINPTPPNLQYGPTNGSVMTVAQLTGVNPSSGNPQAINQINIDWKGHTSTNSTFLPATDKCSTLPNEVDWPYPPLVQFDVIPVGSLSRSDLMSDSLTTFLCPSQAADPANNVVTYANPVGITNNGPIVGGSCSAASSTGFVCHAQITGLDTVNSGTLVIAFGSLYGPADLNITVDGSPASGGEPLNIKGAQTLIDSTGKSQDVLRRVQVRVAQTNAVPIPSGTAAGDICKQLEVGPGAPGREGSAPECSNPSNL